MRPETAAIWYRDPDAFRFIALGYVPWLAGLNLAWEVAHVSLYTLWKEAEPGKPVWRAFFMGGAALPGSKEGKETDLASLASTFKNMVRGITLPWPLVASTLLGVWLMFTRLAFGTEPPMADSDRLIV